MSSFNIVVGTFIVCAFLIWLFVLWCARTAWQDRGIDIDPIETESDESTVRPCRECGMGRHQNCDWGSWDHETDKIAFCPCSLAWHMWGAS